MSHKVFGLSVCLATLVFLGDQATKFWVENVLHDTRILIPGLLKFTPFYNPGFFFGFWHPKYLKVFTVVLSCLVIYVTIDLLKKNRKNQGLLITGVGLIWGGMLGNLADRLISGYVFDFIALWRIPVFNLADTALTLGAAAIMVNLLFCERRIDKVK